MNRNVLVFILFFVFSDFALALPCSQVKRSGGFSSGYLQKTKDVFSFLDQPLTPKAQTSLSRYVKKIDRTQEAIRSKISTSEIQEMILELLEMRMSTSRTLSGFDVKPEEQQKAKEDFIKARDFLVRQLKAKADISEKLVVQIHSLHTSGKISGQKSSYRKDEVSNGIANEYLEPQDVSPAMKDLFRWYHVQKNNLHPIELAARFYQKFVSIHPFDDGNGRTGRDLMDFILLRNGYPPATFVGESVSRAGVFYEALSPGPGERLPQTPSEVVLIVADGVWQSTHTMLISIE